MLYILVMHPNVSVDSLVESLNEQKQPFHELRDTGVLEFLTEIWPLTQFSENYFEPTGSFRDRRRCKDGMQLLSAVTTPSTRWCLNAMAQIR